MLVSMLCILRSNCHSHRILSKILKHKTIELFMKQYFFISKLDEKNAIDLVSLPTSPEKLNPSFGDNNNLENIASNSNVNYNQETNHKDHSQTQSTGILLSQMEERFHSFPLGKTSKLQLTSIMSKTGSLSAAPTATLRPSKEDFAEIKALTQITSKYPKNATAKAVDNFTWSKTQLETLRLHVLSIFQKIICFIPKFFVSTNQFLLQLFKFATVYYQTCQETDLLAQLSLYML